jgi:predicted PurR-regulated permease PerM
MMSTNKTFLALVGLVTLAFAWVLWPLFGALFWGLTLAIVFAPLHATVLTRLGGRRNLAAVTMIFGLLVGVILPMLLIIAAVVQEASALVAAISSGAVDLQGIAQQALAELPLWARGLVQGLIPKDLLGLQHSLVVSVSLWLGANVPLVFSIGQSTAGLVMGLGVTLYLVFFLFRDGESLTKHFTTAIPMPPEVRADLLSTFTTVVRATVQGDIMVALLQGALGGFGFWVLGVHAVLLWTVLMSILALLPVFGAALVWGPVAVYFMATGHVVEGLGLLIYGTLVISLVDNLVRPYLVGKATRIPDFVVLLSTIGGIASFGVQGFITGPVVAAMFIAVWRTFLAQK